MSAQGKYSDGNAINVIAPAGGLVSGTLARVDGWNGVVLQDAAVGEPAVLQIDPAAMFYIPMPAGVAGARGSTLYLPPATSGTATAALTLTATSNTAAVKIEEAKDGNNYVGVRVLNS